MSATPGILYVTMGPKPSLPIAQFHDWYQNEHGPVRLRLPQIFTNGFRYKGTDGEDPEWMAVYDCTDMAYMLKDVYTRWRKEPVQSQRERDTMKQIAVHRKFYDLVSEKSSLDFKALEEVECEGKEDNVIVAALVTLKDASKAAEFDKWNEEEHIPMLTKVPGWRRTRRFVTSHVEPAKTPGETEYLALHEYAPENGLGGPEFKAAISTPWRNDVFTNIIGKKKRRVYSLYYTFGPAPRDLKSLADPAAVPFQSDFHHTTSHPESGANKWPAIESYILTTDGVSLPFRLEGSTDAQAPMIVLCNSILTEYGIWDSFVQEFLSKPENKKYRILRYMKRGRYSYVSDTPVTVDLLAKDIISILDALRVPKAAAVIGVSLGGVTSLNVALKYPNRVSAFIACDTNAVVPPSNPKAWAERIEISEKEGMESGFGEPIVGEELAEITTRRWFVKESYEDPMLAKEAERVKQMVKSNSLEGFRKSVKALYQYDFREEMKGGKVKGAFVVGGGDGVLPKTMEGMKDGYADGSSGFYIIDKAGHLPMIEQPGQFAKIVGKTLNV
ncbi:alpha/beta hydrolase [Venturia nashicola]|uniref:Alpha/beta hydrolase n=1 Tax=Venturia nashicola TaxID=86259 RepID=A0A4Z1NWW0_9PEZI|nr:alpha/beta hydrolase [Venturia nashicola]